MILTFLNSVFHFWHNSKKQKIILFALVNWYLQKCDAVNEFESKKKNTILFFYCRIRAFLSKSAKWSPPLILGTKKAILADSAALINTNTILVFKYWQVVFVHKIHLD